jgi:D-aminopeptidase
MLPDTTRVRARDLGLHLGDLHPGPHNAISDVAGVAVGHVTLIEGEEVRTGVTAITPHPGNPFQERVPAAVVVGNGFGKLIGLSQVQELGELETPILLTNTLAAARVADGLIDWTLAQRGNERVRSVNPVVGETNDGRLNDIRRRGVHAEHALAALAACASGSLPGGNVGAGTGTVAFGFKGGIGNASRRLPELDGAYTVGALVQANFGGDLRMGGVAVGRALRTRGHDPDGSIMMILATDAPLGDRSLRRLAQRAFVGLARTGAAMSHGSGDYAIAFSTHEGVRRRADARAPRTLLDLPDAALTPLFIAAADAVEEAILDALTLAQTLRGYQGRVVAALPLAAVRGLLARLFARGADAAPD